MHAKHLRNVLNLVSRWHNGCRAVKCDSRSLPTVSAREHLGRRILFDVTTPRALRVAAREQSEMGMPLA